MALQKLTPVHKAIYNAIHAIDESISRLKKQRAALVACLPADKKSRRRKTKGKSFIVNPLTGEKGYF
ncbi:MAG: hypothetical protein MI863_20670 [Desulfobacterales bacterium]|nr:hypothetical protein [Desulfobacterales bacterium]